MVVEIDSRKFLRVARDESLLEVPLDSDESGRIKNGFFDKFTIKLVRIVDGV